MNRTFLNYFLMKKMLLVCLFSLAIILPSTANYKQYVNVQLPAFDAGELLLEERMLPVYLGKPIDQSFGDRHIIQVGDVVTNPRELLNAVEMATDFARGRYIYAAIHADENAPFALVHDVYQRLKKQSLPVYIAFQGKAGKNFLRYPDFQVFAPAPPLAQRDLLEVKVNHNGKLLVEGSTGEQQKLVKAVQSFYVNANNDEDFPARYRVDNKVCETRANNSRYPEQRNVWKRRQSLLSHLGNQYMALPENATIFINVGRATTWKHVAASLATVQLEVLHFRNAYCEQHFNLTWTALNNGSSYDSKKVDAVKLIYPDRMLLYSGSYEDAGLTQVEEVPAPPQPSNTAPPVLMIVEDEMQEEELEIPEPTEVPVPNSSPVLDIAEEQPVFPGGQGAMHQFIQRNISYPFMAKENGVQGKVFVSFIVETDGSLSNIKVIRGIGHGCDEEAIRVIKKMPRWQPGKQRGKPVRVRYSLPIHFRLM